VPNSGIESCHADRISSSIASKPSSTLTKLEAREALRAEVTKRTGQNLGGRVLKDGSITFEWFVRNRYFPLRKGDWRPQTAKEKMAQI
jgi:hypothetical protein